MPGKLTQINDSVVVVVDLQEKFLEHVDRILYGFHDAGRKPEQFGATLFCFGCYLGEVLVRNNGAVWLLKDESNMGDFADWPIIFQLQSGTFCNPVGKAFKCLANGSEDSLSYFYAVFSQEDI